MTDGSPPCVLYVCTCCLLSWCLAGRRDLCKIFYACTGLAWLGGQELGVARARTTLASSIYFSKRLSARPPTTVCNTALLTRYADPRGGRLRKALLSGGRHFLRAWLVLFMRVGPLRKLPISSRLLSVGSEVVRDCT